MDAPKIISAIRGKKRFLLSCYLSVFKEPWERLQLWIHFTFISNHLRLHQRTFVLFSSATVSENRSSAAFELHTSNTSSLLSPAVNYKHNCESWTDFLLSETLQIALKCFSETVRLICFFYCFYSFVCFCGSSQLNVDALGCDLRCSVHFSIKRTKSSSLFYLTF